MTAYLLSLFAAVFTGNCDSPSPISTVDSTKCVVVQGRIELTRDESSTATNEAVTDAADNRRQKQLAFEQADFSLDEVFFTLGEKYEGSTFKFVTVKILEQKLDLPCFERACSVKLPNQPTLVALKVILQV